jgi:hypothetical protein
MRSEHSWSLLDPKPVLLYLPQHEDYIVYWNGVVMPHSMALCIAMEYINLWPTPEMKSEMEKTYRRLYYGGAFNSRAWDNRAGNGEVYSYLKRCMADHLKKFMEGKTGQEILSWFDYGRARVEEAEKF